MFIFRNTIFLHYGGKNKPLDKEGFSLKTLYFIKIFIKSYLEKNLEFLDLNNKKRINKKIIVMFKNGTSIMFGEFQ